MVEAGLFVESQNHTLLYLSLQTSNLGLLRTYACNIRKH